MKKFVYILLLIGMNLSLSYGQMPLDSQWLVINQMGKMGLQGYNTHVCNSSTTCNNVFAIQGVKHPDLTLNPNAKNDVFVIYSDLQHFNSRNKGAAPTNPPNFFYPVPANAKNLQHENHSFQTTHNSSIQYLYLTNIYEGNDPPPSVKASNQLSGYNDFNGQPYPIDITIPSHVLTASHDVIREADITLIVANQLLNPTKSYTLTFNTVVPVGGGRPIIGRQFFLLQGFNLNGSTPILPPSGAGTITSDRIQLARHPGPFTYVNLRPNLALLEPFFPDTSGDVTHQFVFNIVEGNDGGGGQPFYSLTEDLRDSHDPNSVNVVNVYEDPLTHKSYACYLIEFENTSLTPASQLEIGIQFDTDIWTQCIDEKNWTVADQPAPGHIQPERHDVTIRTPFGNHTFTFGELADGDELGSFFRRPKVEFIFPRSAYIRRTPDGMHPELAKGSIIFWVKLDPTKDWSDITNVLRPTHAYVSFNKKATQIKKFNDFTAYKYEGGDLEIYRPVNNTGYHCTCR